MRRRATLIAATPAAAALMLVFGSLSPAWAFNGFTGAACNDRHVCYYANINLSPSGGSNDILNINGLVENWQNIPDPAGVCGGIVTFTWNDCASSIFSRYHTSTEYAWTNSFCGGSRFKITPGAVINSVGTFNDTFSSDRDDNSASGC